MNCVKRPDNWGRTESQSYGEFLAGIGAAVWPVVARAQQGERMRRIGMLCPDAEGDPEVNAWLATFREELEKLGWAEGRNMRKIIGGRDLTKSSVQRFAREPSRNKVP